MHPFTAVVPPGKSGLRCVFKKQNLSLELKRNSHRNLNISQRRSTLKFLRGIACQLHIMLIFKNESHMGSRKIRAVQVACPVRHGCLVSLRGVVAKRPVRFWCGAPRQPERALAPGASVPRRCDRRGLGGAGCERSGSGAARVHAGAGESAVRKRAQMLACVRREAVVVMTSVPRTGHVLSVGQQTHGGCLGLGPEFVAAVNCLYGSRARLCFYRSPEAERLVRLWEHGCFAQKRARERDAAPPRRSRWLWRAAPRGGCCWRAQVSPWLCLVVLAGAPARPPSGLPRDTLFTVLVTLSAAAVWPPGPGGGGDPNLWFCLRKARPLASQGPWRLSRLTHRPGTRAALGS